MTRKFACYRYYFDYLKIGITVVQFKIKFGIVRNKALL